MAGLTGLRGKCICPRDYRHEPLRGKDRTSRAAGHPMELAMEYAKLVIKAWRTTLNLEWWRHLEKQSQGTLKPAQLSWIKPKERSGMGKLLEVDEMQEFRNNKRKWMEGTEEVGGHQTQTSTSKKKSRKEDHVRFYVGGLRNPHLAVDKLAVLHEAGQDIARLWNSFVKEYTQAF